MRILIVGHILPYPPRGGCSLRNFNLIKECSKEHELHLITFYRNAHFYEDVSFEESLKKMRQHCAHVSAFPIPAERSKWAYSRILASNLLSEYPYSTALYESADFRNALKDHLDRFDFDVMELGEIGMYRYASTAPELPKVMIHHNIESQLLFRRAKASASLFKRKYLTLQAERTEQLERIAGDQIEAHTTVSDIDRETLLKINPRVNAVTVPNGVDTEYFRATTSEVRPNSIAFVGGLNWYPNRDGMEFFVDRIWPLIKREVPDANLTLIGKRSSESIERFARKNPDIHLTGMLGDIRPIVSESAVFVVPLRVGGGTRLKILDAMSLGKAIVSTSIGCEGIDVEDGENIAIADDADGFAEKVIELLKDKEERESIGGNARQSVEEKYSWTKIAPLLGDLYKNLARAGDSNK